MNQTALFLGRFQPPHLWHIDALNQAIAQWVTKILIWIWSADKEHTKDNPFNYSERESMLKLLCNTQNNLIIKNASENIFSIPDFNNDELWKNYILQNVPNFDYIITWNPRVEKIFQKTDIKIISIQNRNMDISASTIRKRLAQWNKVDCLEFMPQIIIEQIEKIWWIKRLSNLLKERAIPRLAVDIILFNKEWKLILIKRKHPPLWLALPGWMVEYWEAPHLSAIREAQEELWVKIKILWNENKPLGVYWNPDRDPRWHVISLVYKCEIESWELKAWDDAAKLIFIDPKEIEKHKLVFDHKQILMDILN